MSNNNTKNTKLVSRPARLPSVAALCARLGVKCLLENYAPITFTSTNHDESYYIARKAQLQSRSELLATAQL